MESVYYLTHPRIDKSAVVYAPTTEKARTTFLDWLERGGIIRRAHRNFFRKDMIAERIEDPNVPCDVVLDYGYKDFTGRFELEPEHVQRQRLAEEWAEKEQDVDLPEERLMRALEGSVREQKGFGTSAAKRELGIEEEEDEPSIEIGELATNPKGRMPIQEVMLRGYVE